MIIGFDGSRAFSTPRTGTEEYSYQLLSHLAKIDQRNEYHIFLRHTGIKENLSGKIWPANFKFITLKPDRFWTQLGLAYQTFTDNLDVLFIPSHTLPLIAKPKLKTVVTVHDLGNEFLPKTHQLKQLLYLKFMTHYQIKHSSAIIAVSEATKNDIVKKISIPSQKITVIHEGLNRDLFKPPTITKVNQTINQYKLEYQKYFLFVGTVQPRKNLANLIRAFSLQLSGDDLPTLVIAGIKGWLSDQIYRLPKNLGIEDQVKFLGFVPEEDLPALYCGAKAFLYPSLFEGFGLPILSAQACGCPVLTSNTSSMPEVAGKGAVFVEPTSVESIYQGIKEIERLKIRDQLVKEGFKNIKRFSWEKAARATLQVFERVYEG